MQQGSHNQKLHLFLTELTIWAPALRAHPDNGAITTLGELVREEEFCAWLILNGVDSEVVSIGILNEVQDIQVDAVIRWIVSHRLMFNALTLSSSAYGTCLGILGQWAVWQADYLRQISQRRWHQELQTASARE